MIVDKIKAYLDGENRTLAAGLADEAAAMIAERFTYQFMQPRQESKGVLRLSSCGKCPRALAYKYHGFPENGKEIDARALMNFFLGDVVEGCIVGLAQLAGCNLVSVGSMQLEVKQKYGDVEVVGYPDGILFWNQGFEDGKSGAGKTQRYLLEVKSMSSFGFRKFEKYGEIESSYLAQVNEYMHALKMDACVFVALAKDSAAIAEKVVKYDPGLSEDVEGSIISVVESTPESLPPRKHKPADNGKLPWNCLYCSNWRDCWLSAERVVERGRYALYAR